MASSGPSQEASHLRSIIQRQAAAWAGGDVEGIVSAFSDPCEFIVPRARLTTPDQVRRAAQEYFRQRGDTRVAVGRIVVEGDSAAVEWTWSDQDLATGEVTHAEDAIVVRIDRGEIVYWREYIDNVSCISAACAEASEGATG